MKYVFTKFTFNTLTCTTLFGCVFSHQSQLSSDWLMWLSTWVEGIVRKKIESGLLCDCDWDMLAYIMPDLPQHLKWYCHIMQLCRRIQLIYDWSLPPTGGQPCLLVSIHFLELETRCSEPNNQSTVKASKCYQCRDVMIHWLWCKEMSNTDIRNRSYQMMNIQTEFQSYSLLSKEESFGFSSVSNSALFTSSWAYWISRHSENYYWCNSLAISSSI